MSGIPSWARVGAKVVCVTASHPHPSCAYNRKSKFPVVGEVYTIRHVAEMRSGVGCWLDEIVNPIGNPLKGWNGETGFHLAKFRPLHTLESDLEAHFSQLLDVPALVHEAAE